MHKKSLILSLSVILILTVACKKNKPQPNFSDEKKVHIAGSRTNSAGVSVPTIWINGVPQDLSANEGAVYSIFLSGDDIYATGYELIGTGSDRIAKVWKNGVAQTLPSATNYASGEQIVFAGGKVYVLGFENFSYKTALWVDGVKQSFALPEHPSNAGNQNVGLGVAGSDIYTSGLLRNAAGLSKAAVLKNGARIGIDTTANTYSIIERVFVNGADVYMAGVESEAGKIKARLWKNGAKQQLADLPAEAYAAGVFVSGNDVYMVGEDRTYVPGRVDLVVWKNGNVIHRMGGSGKVLNASGIVVLNGDVYVGGDELVQATGHIIIKVWKNGVEQNVTNGTSDNDINAIAVK